VSGDVYWYWSGTNQSPLVTRAFLEQQRRILMPGQYAREHQNTWVDSADSFTSAAEIDDAMASGRVEEMMGRRDVESEVFVDFGSVHDPTVICVGHRDGDRVVIVRLITFKGSREHPVQVAAVEATLRDLCAQWRVRKIRIESWQGISSVQSLARLGLPVELFSPTAKAHAEEWPVLAQRLSSRTLDLFPHAALREELLNLVYEVGPSGIRVIDRGAVHQDHAVAVRGVCAQLHPRRRSVVGILLPSDGPADRAGSAPHRGADGGLYVADPDEAAERHPNRPAGWGLGRWRGGSWNW
jgi:hypothetical protein